jgi:hypothetical protein
VIEHSGLPAAAHPPCCGVHPKHDLFDLHRVAAWGEIGPENFMSAAIGQAALRLQFGKAVPQNMQKTAANPAPSREHFGAAAVSSRRPRVPS